MPFKKKIFSVIVTSMLIVCCSSCGRKQRDIFQVFHKHNDTTKPLQSFPSVRGVSVLCTAKGTYISWKGLACFTTQHHDAEKKLIGYNIYPVYASGFVAKERLNKDIIKEKTFLDQQQPASPAYLIKGIFLDNKKMIEGPPSKIAKNS